MSGHVWLQVMQAPDLKMPSKRLITCRRSALQQASLMKESFCIGPGHNAYCIMYDLSEMERKLYLVRPDSMASSPIAFDVYAIAAEPRREASAAFRTARLRNADIVIDIFRCEIANIFAGCASEKELAALVSTRQHHRSPAFRAPLVLLDTAGKSICFCTIISRSLGPITLNQRLRL